MSKYAKPHNRFFSRFTPGVNYNFRSDLLNVRSLHGDLVNSFRPFCKLSKKGAGDLSKPSFSHVSFPITPAKSSRLSKVNVLRSSQTFNSGVELCH